MEDIPAADPEWTYLCERRALLKLRTLMNRLYQQERQRIMERREGIVKAASLVAGSVAFARVVNADLVSVCASVIFLGTACSLVFGWGGKARDAAKRAAEWIGIDRDMDKCGERHFTEDDLNNWAARCNESEASEPAPNRALLETCYQQACKALGMVPGKDGPWYTGPRPVLLIP